MHSHAGNVVSHCVLRKTCSHKFLFFDNLSPLRRLISNFFKYSPSQVWIPNDLNLPLLKMDTVIPDRNTYFFALLFLIFDYVLPLSSLSENVSVKYVNIFCETRTFYLRRQSSGLLDKSEFFLGR